MVPRQAYEMLLLRMRASQLSEARAFAELMLRELRRVIPSFVARVDRQSRGVAWSENLAQTEWATRVQAVTLLGGSPEVTAPEATLTEFDPDGEVKIVASALYPVPSLPDSQLLVRARQMSVDERIAVLRAYVGDRNNRRHRPGRAFEGTHYRFDVVADYGAFRDLQRHRMLTIEWQTLSAAHGYVVASDIEERGALVDWCRVMDTSAELHYYLISNNYLYAARYAVSMAYRIRFYMEMNAREAMHVIEYRGGNALREPRASRVGEVRG